MSLAIQITAAGATIPTYAEVLTSLQNSFYAIYGADAYIAPDSQDGQLLAVFAEAITDCNQGALAAYNSFSPSTAQGAGLASVIKINGIAKKAASFSSVDVLLVGQIGATITSGIVEDTNGNKWLLPYSVTIPPAGQITVTATAQALGAIVAVAGSVTRIVTPTFGWQSVTNLAAATPGSPVESDAALRLRQTDSVANPARTVLESTTGQLKGLDGVIAVQPYENDTGVTDANGLPHNTISMVVEGGDAQQIAEAIARKKTPGTGTYGTTSSIVVDSNGVPNTIRFFRPTVTGIKMELRIQAQAGYSSATGDQLKAALAGYGSTRGIGGTVFNWEEYAIVRDATPSPSFKVLSITQGLLAGALSAADLVPAFNQRYTCATADVVIVIV